MDEEKDFLEFMKTNRVFDDIAKRFGIQTGLSLLKKFTEEGFLELTEDKIILKKEGRDRLSRLTKERSKESKFGDVKIDNSGGGPINFQQGDYGNASQDNSVSMTVPKKDIDPILEFFLKIAEKIGVKLSLWILGILGFGGTGFFVYGLSQVANINTVISPSLIGISSLGFFFLMGFLILVLAHKYRRCLNPSCGKILGYEEVGDGKVLARAPTGEFKIQRFYKCKKCGEVYSITRWENHNRIKNSPYG